MFFFFFSFLDAPNLKRVGVFDFFFLSLVTEPGTINQITMLHPVISKESSISSSKYRH